MKIPQQSLGDARDTVIESQLTDKPSAYLFCRTFGHNWEDPERRIRDTDTVRISVVCGQCGGETWKDLTLRGSIVGTGSRMPGDYLMRGTGRLSTEDRDVIRAAYIVRLAEGA